MSLDMLLYLLRSCSFIWNDACESALIQLKRKLVEPLILMYPDFNKRFKMYVDSSKLAVGVCLMQAIDSRAVAIAFACKLLDDSEKNWIISVTGHPKSSVGESFGLLVRSDATWIVMSVTFTRITRIWLEWLTTPTMSYGVVSITLQSILQVWDDHGSCGWALTPPPDY
ncbi:Uncharacterized protein PHPALM_27937 [Phytophthora palmivora]|uniref:Reverse transcriptase/retrotransposon-derived protein RNase H-like domain-containing protein n=1 Tax=Phytophthora palmivora TaxID=4796 RepID=A0A2P4XBC3_9STRA|nr:Uncharacterized protein PHPALM_27937 [Phytophthora palmivora]